MSRSLGVASLWMIVSSTILNLSMVVYHRVMSGGLHPWFDIDGLGDKYAELLSLNGLFQVLFVLVMGLAAYFTKLFARDQELVGTGAAWVRLRRMLPRLGIIEVFVAIALLAVGPLVVAFLKLDNYVGYWLIVGLFVMGLVLLVERSFIQGIHRFGWFGATLIAEGLSRVFFAVLLVWMGWKVSAGLASSLFAQVVGFAAGFGGFLALGAKLEPPAPENPNETSMQRYCTALFDTLALGLLALLVMQDIFVVKHAWTDEAASLYGRASIVAKSFLYLTSALSLVLLPVVAAAKARGEDTRLVLLKFLTASALILLAGYAVVWVFTEWVIGILCGPLPEFLALAPLVRWFSLAMIPLSLFQLILFYMIGTGHKVRTPLIVGLNLFFGAALMAWHDTPENIVMCIGLTSLTALVLGLVASMLRPTGIVEKAA